ncbi:amino acid-binding domain sensor histidine kinase [Magnetococcus marinus MC-1]|uniref:histidine kinase n=2 Tax=Magnetococcus TaxID=162171 RepID=A0L8K9_MAGMM|nr:amino acid-binding domain sensor histidine kinase [Magnetococcus marinus MC-1]
MFFTAPSRSFTGQAYIVVTLLVLCFVMLFPPFTVAENKLKEPSFLLELTEQEQAYLKAKGEIRMCVDPDWMPYEMIDEQGRHVGMAADYMKVIAQLLSVPIQLVPTKSWMDSLSHVQTGNCEILSLLNKTPQRSTFLDFTTPYMETPIVLVTRNDVTYLNGLSDLSGHTLATTKGYVYTENIKHDYPEIPLVEVDTVREGLNRVSRGEVFAQVGMLFVLVNTIQEGQISNLKISGHTDYMSRMGIGVRKGEPLLLSVLDKAVKTITPQQHINIRQNWTATRFEHGRDYALLWQVVVGFLLITMLIVFWLRQSRREINHRLSIEKKLLEKGLQLNQTLHELSLRNKALEETVLLRENVERITKHDLKGPLNSIIGLPDVLLEDATLDDEKRAMLHTIQSNGYRMLEMINRSLDLYKMEIGEYRVNKVQVPIGYIMRQLISEFGRMAAAKGVDIVTQVEPKNIHLDQVFIYGEELLTYSMFANLLKNAIEAVQQQSGVITVKVMKAAQVVIRIHNPGAVPEEIRSRFFEKYVTAGKSDGSGLGTYSARLISETLGGNIAMQTSEEQGTTITVTLPLPPTYALSDQDHRAPL